MLKKQYIKSRKVCKVSFILPKSEQPKDVKIKKVFLVGDFNGWNKNATQMKKNSKGEFRAVIDLDPGKDYQFRYLINGEIWYNEWEADSYLPNDQGGDNCVVKALSGPN